VSIGGIPPVRGRFGEGPSKRWCCGRV